MPDTHAFDLIGDRISRDGWVALPDFVAPGMVSSLREESAGLAAQGSFLDAGLGSGADHRVDGDVRADQILWLESSGSSDAQRECLERFEQLRLRLNRDLQLGLFEFECHFARYAPGAFYRKHLDQFSRDSRRRLSSILYLNADWQEEDGGELRLYLERTPVSGHVDIKPSGGTLVLFLSERFPHEVLPARRERLSLTGWYKARG
ncbi:MAG TPA: 2OG-Fe(II) oxygenase [Burkholderiales bacterium]